MGGGSFFGKNLGKIKGVKGAAIKADDNEINDDDDDKPKFSGEEGH